MPNIKLKTYNTGLNKMIYDIFGHKDVKLHEDRHLLACFLITKQSQPEPVEKLGNILGTNEMVIIPRSLFASDGSLLIPNDKSSFLKVESFSPKTTDLIRATTYGEMECNSCGAHTATALESMDINTEGMKKLPDTNKANAITQACNFPSNADDFEPKESRLDRERVIIIDGHTVVQRMKKFLSMHKISNLTNAFVKRIKMVKQYVE